MRKKVYRELNEYEGIMSMINSKQELSRELKDLESRDYRLTTTAALIASVMGSIMSVFGTEKLVNTYTDANDIHYGALCIIAGGLILGGIGIKDLVKIKEQKYMDKEKIKIVSRKYRRNDFSHRNKTK